jgi:peroxiredoxin
MLLTIFTIVVPWLLVAAGSWLLFELTRLCGRMLLRLDTLSEQVQALQARTATAGSPPAAAAKPAGLPIGSAAPAFDLPDLSGVRHSLASFRGKSVLAIFFNPKCGHCERMTGALAKLDPEGAEGRPVPLVISTGSLETNRELVEKAGLKCRLLLQTETEVGSQYLANGTPMGYLIAADGTIASPLIVGADAILAVASGRAPAVPATPMPPSDIPLGSQAPDFELADLAGNRRSLSDFSGRRLLIFFSPQCGFCTRMADDLARLPLSAGQVLPLLISAGTAADNQSMVDEYGLRCPLLLQGQVDVGSRYGCSGTPMGYLIDEQGRIASPKLAGATALLALCRTAAEAPDEAISVESSRDEAVAPAIATIATQTASDLNDDHPPCGKCKDRKEPCARCSIPKSKAATPASDATPYDILDLRSRRGIDETTNELLSRSENCLRLIVIHGDGTQPLSGTESAALRRFLRERTEWGVSFQPETANRFLVLSRDPHDRKALPSLFAKAANFAKALSKHVADGAGKISSEQMERRLEICTLCDRRSGDHCSACGCDLPTKAGWRTSTCPVGKWPTMTIHPVA